MSSEETVVIRDAASSAEWREAIDLMSQVFVNEGFTSVTTGAGLFLEHRLRVEGELVIAVSAHGVVGAVLIVKPASAMRQVARTDDELEFRLLAVSPGARGAGVGRRLVDECLTRAVDRAMTRVVICTQPSMLRAQALYESRGFQRDEQRDWQTPDGGQRLVFVRTLT